MQDGTDVISIETSSPFIRLDGEKKGKKKKKKSKDPPIKKAKSMRPMPPVNASLTQSNDEKIESLKQSKNDDDLGD